MARNFDAIVIGSGIGGLACGCALSRTGHKVLMLERHSVPGGLTQTFSRKGFTWDVGLHYLGEMGPEDFGRRVLDWLVDKPIEFASLGPVYDMMHFPGGFDFQYARPAAALKRELRERFPQSANDIDAYFKAVEEARTCGRAIFSGRAMPAAFARLAQAWKGRGIERWWSRSTEEVLLELVRDEQLRAVLAGQRADYGPDPREASFGIHATVTHHYFDGAYYPVEGAQAFAAALVPVIEKAGGEVRTSTEVTELLLERGVVSGVRVRDGSAIHCSRVFSDAGAYNTTMRLMPTAMRSASWIREIASLRPSAPHVQLYLGLEGDIAGSGATRANHWFHERWDLNEALWANPAEEPVPPVLFVSFPSLKGGASGGSQRLRHTAEIVAFTKWDAFSAWENSNIGHRPQAYGDLKRLIEQRLLAQFSRHFPALAPMVVEREVSTPLSTVTFTGAMHGGVYGLEASPRRFLSASLRARTPIPGLYLAGQDVASAGITGAMMGGLLAAAAVEPRVLTHIPLN